MGFFDDAPRGLDRPGAGACWHPPVGELPCVAVFGIPGARTGTDAQPILDAAQRSVQLWSPADP